MNWRNGVVADYMTKVPICSSGGKIPKGAKLKRLNKDDTFSTDRYDYYIVEPKGVGVPVESYGRDREAARHYPEIVKKNPDARFVFLKDSKVEKIR